MNPRFRTARAWRPALLATMTLAALPGIALSSDAAQDRAIRDLELQQEQQQAQREMAQRERMQREALRGQEQSIQRLEQARQRLENSTREVAELSTQLGRNYQVWEGTTGALPPPPRALLGLSVSEESRADGALVLTVSPGGAAAEAGIREGDVLVTLDGRDLTQDASPGRALVTQMRQVTPDRPLRVELLREGRRMALQVTPRSGPAAGAADRLVPQRNGSGARVSQPFPATGVELPGLRLGGMEFATLSDRLGSYFGVSAGVLVVRAGPGAPFTLQDGDVILSIDGRTPTSAQHAARILRSYQPGEKVKLRVQRDRNAMDLDTTAPAGR